MKKSDYSGVGELISNLIIFLITVAFCYFGIFLLIKFIKFCWLYQF